MGLMRAMGNGALQMVVVISCILWAAHGGGGTHGTSMYIHDPRTGARCSMVVPGLQAIARRSYISIISQLPFPAGWWAPWRGMRC